MVRDYVRNGRGWSQPNVNGNGSMAGGRKLPKPPPGPMNAMAALQGMLGFNQPNLTNMLGNMNGSVPNINNSISNVSAMTQPFGLMTSAVRRLPQIPPTTAGVGGQMVGDLGVSGQVAGGGQPQQSWISKLFKRNAATPQQETNQRLQQQLLINQQQSNLNQQQILAGQQPLVNTVQQPLVNTVLPGQAGGQFGQVHVQPPPQFSASMSMPMSNSLSQLQLMNNPVQNGGFPVQPLQPVIVNNLQQPLQQPLVKKPGEGWGGRGAKLPKVPVPLPSLPPNKATGYSGSHSFEEIEEDLFLDRIVAVGRGSRRLPNPADAKTRPGKRLTRQNGVFKRGFSLDSDEYDAQESFRP